MEAQWQHTHTKTQGAQNNLGSIRNKNITHHGKNNSYVEKRDPLNTLCFLVFIVSLDLDCLFAFLQASTKMDVCEQGDEEREKAPVPSCVSLKSDHSRLPPLAFTHDPGASETK